ncbi:MAG: aminotransferase class V-fold PLP-dependent enzyme [Anaerolineae bacterium]|jgi:molybdenum cofactor sulfurtransferase|nr:aminotransferase class V-fold PLP-dependent enzyme [Anaerolineae bacterium]MBT7189085.1 aminotransferase class V-fold PLP-dependent enzyme [Anaerolineae bacterium]MBT7990358.1 aminotransferase class V-fold PLP-dependent enzyme [Anaerolineae bacterium]
MSQKEFKKFLAAYPSYKDTEKLDTLRAEDYSRLDKLGHVYLDYTGGGLYAESQISKHQEILQNNVFGNPHSTNPTSMAATELVDSARAYVLEFFNADPAEYEVIFTANASGALKLIGEAYPFDEKSRYMLAFDNHNSVNGLREYAHARGAKVSYLPVTLPELRLPEEQLRNALRETNPDGQNLFSFPAQSNFSGIQHPLEWIEEAKSQGWDVLLDAAAFVPTNKLDLSRYAPDFVVLSFYKLFGYPTGLGALIARREALSTLQRPWFAGGTITVASVQASTHYMAEGHAAFEDGTVDYLNIPGIEIGLRHIAEVGYDAIHERVVCLTGWLIQNLARMKHSTGEPLARIYGDLQNEMRGGTIAANFYNKDGLAFDHRYIEEQANKLNISLRTGCFCNPGAGEIALELEETELLACFSKPRNKQRLSFDDFAICFDGQESGAVRISVGIASNFSDVQILLDFMRGLLE